MKKTKSSPYPLVFYSIECEPLDFDKKRFFNNPFLQTKEHRARFIVSKSDYKKK